MALSPEAYRRRLDSIREAILDRVLAEYDVDIGDIDASFEAYAKRIEPLIRSGQATAQQIAAAFIRQTVIDETGRPYEVTRTDVRPGQTTAGDPLAVGMAAIPGLMLRAIANGRPADDAVETFGKFLVGRFADSEVTSTADREYAAQARAARIVGWDGIVSPAACPECRSRNTGFHDWETPIYRHGACTCVMSPVFA